MSIPWAKMTCAAVFTPSFEAAAKEIVTKGKIKEYIHLVRTEDSLYKQYNVFIARIREMYEFLESEPADEIYFDFAKSVLINPLVERCKELAVAHEDTLSKLNASYNSLSLKLTTIDPEQGREYMKSTMIRIGKALAKAQIKFSVRLYEAEKKEEPVEKKEESKLSQKV